MSLSHVFYIDIISDFKYYWINIEIIVQDSAIGVELFIEFVW